MNRVYADAASAVPLSSAAERVLKQSIKLYGNPSALHSEGREARALLNKARAEIARALSVQKEQLTFTSGGTESNTLAIHGVAHALLHARIPLSEQHFITSSAEHASVDSAFGELEKRGASVTYISTGSSGTVPVEAVIDAITERTVLISLVHTVSESGVFQPVREVGRALRERRLSLVSKHSRTLSGTAFPLLHVDASQALMYSDPSPHTMQADVVSYDAHKCGGPKGVGILYSSDLVPLAPVLFGGTQERSRRPGTENVAGIAASAAAITDAVAKRKQRAHKVADMCAYLHARMLQKVPSARLIGSLCDRAPNTVQYEMGVDTDYLTVLLDARGVAVSPRSACAGTGKGAPPSTLRISLLPTATKKDCDQIVNAIVDALPLTIATGLVY